MGAAALVKSMTAKEVSFSEPATTTRGILASTRDSEGKVTNVSRKTLDISFACGYVTVDGAEHLPFPYGPNWPTLSEFEFVAKQESNLWVCNPLAKTARARRLYIHRGG